MTKLERRTGTSLLFIAALLIAAPAASQTADVTGTLTIFTEDENGLSTSATPISGSAVGVFFGTGGASFTLPSAVFVQNSTSLVGFTSNASPNSIYTIRTITNTSNLAGAFSGTAGSGPYGGIMSVGSVTTSSLGLVPLPGEFGAIVVPLNAGIAGTTTAMASILANAVTVTVSANPWTTGVITVLTSPASPATVSGSNALSAGGGTITLVTPFLVQVGGAASSSLAGFAELNLTFSNVVPEPGVLLLLGCAAAALCLGARRRR